MGTHRYLTMLRGIGLGMASCAKPSLGNHEYHEDHEDQHESKCEDSFASSTCSLINSDLNQVLDCLWHEDITTKKKERFCWMGDLILFCLCMIVIQIVCVVYRLSRKIVLRN